MIGVEEKKAIIGLMPFMSERPVVFDVGSNKGHFTDIILSEFKDDCDIHLFEPVDILLNFTRIKYEYHTNIVYNSAVVWWKNVGPIVFYYFDNYNNELSSAYKDDNQWSGLPLKEKKIKTVSVDEYCESAGVNFIDYIKVDCEGADVDVLIGCEKLMKSGSVGIIQIEYSEHYKRAEKLASEIFEISKRHGYVVYKFVEDNYWEVKTSDNLTYDNYFLTKYEIHNYSVGGWNGQFLLNTSELPKFDLCLEIGAFEGITTKHIATSMLNDEGRVVVVDPLMDYYIEGDTEHNYFKDQYQRFLRNTRGLPVELHRGKSESELPKLNELRFGFIYVDGDHRKDAVYFDLVWSFAICKSEGFILIDDYTWRPETTEGIDRFLDEFSGFYDIIAKNYQVLIKKVTNRYNEITQQYYL